MNGSLTDEVDAVLRRGLLDTWYAIVPSCAVSTAPVTVRRRGEELVLWRSAGGTIHVQRDRCPHRGVRLSLGRVFGERLACRYHGVQVDGQGRIADVPALPDCPLVGRKGVRTFPAVESGGAIFAYFGLNEEEEPRPFVPPVEFESDEWASMICTARWDVNYRYAFENTVDPMHGPYLHGNSFTMAYGAKSDVMQIEDTALGFRIWRQNQRDVNVDEVECFDGGASWVRLDIPYPPGAGPGGPFRILGTVCPIDEDSTQVFFWRLRRVSGWQRDLWRFMYRDRLEERHWAVLEQDHVILETSPADAREHEMLYQHDIGITRLRKIMRDRVKRELSGSADRPRAY
jgi:phenylpropionate dioxygenase-like ring-hydroxylating dioxygenase large terminal subunit